MRDHGHHRAGLSISEPSLPISRPFHASLLTTALGTGVAGLLTMAVPWSLLSAGADPLWAGVAAAALHVPVALGLWLGGRLVERIGARAVLLASDAASAAAVAGALLAVADPSALPVVIALLALANGLGAPGSVAQDARMPELARLARVPLARANSVREITVTVAQVAGPVTGVLLADGWGLTGVVRVAATVLALATLVDLGTFPRFRRHRGSGKATTMGGELAVLAADPALRTVILVALPLVAVLGALDEIVAPALALSAGLGADAMAVFLGLAGAGALASGALHAVRGHRLPARPIVLAGLSSVALGLAALAMLPPAPAFLVAPVLVGLGVGPLWPIIVTVIHRRVPAAGRGPAIGTVSAFILLAQPAAAVAAGPAVGALGAPVIAVGLAAAAAVAFAAPILPGLRILDARPLSGPAPIIGETRPMRFRPVPVAGAVALVAAAGWAMMPASPPPEPIRAPAPVVPPAGIGAHGRIEPASRALKVGRPLEADGARIERLMVFPVTVWRPGTSLPSSRIIRSVRQP